jgi:DNA-binding transcriptional LysR family regulator
MERIEQLEAFVRVAELGSFSSAARDLACAQSQVSRAVRALEQRLGSRLFARSTRRVALTQEGRRYLDGARQAISALANAADAVHASNREVAGVLRVTAPLGFGDYLAPVLAALVARHPALSIDALLVDRLVDLIAEGFDVAVRIGPLPPSALRARRLGETQAILCAAPAYLEARGMPRHPRELTAHEHILFTVKPKPERLRLVDGQQRTASVRITGRLRTNDLGLLCRAAGAGAGIAAVPRPLVAASLRQRLLREVLPDWTLPPSPIHAVYPVRTPQPARVSAFVDAMAAALRARRAS